jgi:hypothetical protein
MGHCLASRQVSRTRLQVSSVSEVKTNEPKAGTSGNNGAAEKAPEYYEVRCMCPMLHPISDGQI